MDEIDLLQLKADIESSGGSWAHYKTLSLAVLVLLDEVFKTKEEIKAIKDKNK